MNDFYEIYKQKIVILINKLCYINKQISQYSLAPELHSRCSLQILVLKLEDLIFNPYLHKKRQKPNIPYKNYHN